VAPSAVLYGRARGEGQHAINDRGLARKERQIVKAEYMIKLQEPGAYGQV